MYSGTCTCICNFLDFIFRTGQSNKLKSNLVTNDWFSLALKPAMDTLYYNKRTHLDIRYLKSSSLIRLLTPESSTHDIIKYSAVNQKFDKNMKKRYLRIPLSGSISNKMFLHHHLSTPSYSTGKTYSFYNNVINVDKLNIYLSVFPFFQ